MPSRFSPKTTCWHLAGGLTTKPSCKRAHSSWEITGNCGGSGLGGGGGGGAGAGIGAGAPPTAWSWIAELGRAARKAVDRKFLWETGAAKAQHEKVARTRVQRILIDFSVVGEPSPPLH